jgi:5'-phosphate synthase pdxT subunit
MTLGIEREGLAEPLRQFVRSGRPTLGTCAGLIMLDRDHLGVLDVAAERNAFGRQTKSFEADLDMPQLGADALRAVFIRAPWITDTGDGVEVLAEVDGHPVAVRQGNVLAVAFHPELTDDPRVHAWLVDRVRENVPV